MGDLLLKVVTSVLGGTFVYVVTKFIFDSILEQKKVIGEIANSLIFYTNVYTNVMSKEALYREASEKFRKLASSLTSSIHTIPSYSIISKTKIIVNKSMIVSVIKELIGLSNGCLGLINGQHSPIVIHNNQECVNNIKRLLKIDFPD